ncbi:hypothetical protein CONPUDRAFT_57919 [Coniophora puteana RWD-64-598 SS2]|uniref:Complex 1 LYR protein domain-containing protein n=1 Tax=Coniophora puteana (strain RWD-64-598) TaxID=741705 RepID=A0A5M3MLA6_CONPW|nr:uncharacterized protein CONPUDRAFT_57919 [Coniophora puteana RWD-64-598 SS2]EIW79740.1 hypothetical protein CONPUDRAFT_57919 [Coniophora puteana RWD-64-598 SS2]
MATAPTKQAIRHLYSNTLAAAKSFSSYNFRNYFVQRTEDTFRTLEHEHDFLKQTSLFTQAEKDLAVLKRCAIVNQIYGGGKLAVETQSEVRERGDT